MEKQINPYRKRNIPADMWYYIQFSQLDQMNKDLVKVLWKEFKFEDTLASNSPESKTARHLTWLINCKTKAIVDALKYDYAHALVTPLHTDDASVEKITVRILVDRLEDANRIAKLKIGGEYKHCRSEYYYRRVNLEDILPDYIMYQAADYIKLSKCINEAITAARRMDIYKLYILKVVDDRDKHFRRLGVGKVFNRNGTEIGYTLSGRDMFVVDDFFEIYNESSRKLEIGFYIQHGLLRYRIIAPKCTFYKEIDYGKQYFNLLIKELKYRIPNIKRKSIDVTLVYPGTVYAKRFDI